MRKYSRPLKVSTPEGERIVANVFQQGPHYVVIEIAPLEVVKKDDPDFAHDGLIRFRCKKKEYQKVIDLLTQYLEDLFLKGMADEDIYTSLGSKPRRTGNIELDSEIKIRGIKKPPEERSDSSVHDRSRGDEQTEDSGGRDYSVEVDTSSDSQNSGEGESGD